ncbi:AraC-like DNA-binding protein [Chryseobacterium sp. 7]|uniref:helix-turn-helix transcriptional regulator n=1 Tax=Chryseobacterium sp. 7 TaxID=2035214 RepID=UPI000EADBE6F|nr:helix-turn-helix transcriptional regulator [Chryseobacterium sp. 7]RLJ23202.1 AraC-like DNA-binding protein [Chryseobacterium sp. 7]
MEDFYLENTERLKKRFIQQYNTLTYSILIILIVVFQFYIYIPKMVYYLLGGLIFLIYSNFLIKNRYSANQIIRAYMIIAPAYHFYIMLTFWNNSISLFATLFPLPLAAYVFFSKKSAVRYLLYMLGNILACYITLTVFDIHFPKYGHNEVIVSDILNFIYTFAVIVLLFIYHDKLNKLQILTGINKTEPDFNAQSIDQHSEFPDAVKSIKKETPIDHKTVNEVFEKLNHIMTTKKLFKDPKLNISMLSIQLNINYNYLSKIIRNKGYQNFNAYLNEYRINYVKKLMSETDLQKITLMYIYTEAGFSNQTTFNRVFKQIEDITPSEYIHKNFPSQNIQ